MLQKLGIAPGFNKQVTETGAEGQWFDGDNVRFRYGSPEKIGGWQQLGQDKLTGAARAIHHWDDNAGIKYAAIGTNRILYVYSGGTYYDIHPIRQTITGATFSSTSSTKTVTVNCGTSHGLSEDDIVLFEKNGKLKKRRLSRYKNRIKSIISESLENEFWIKEREDLFKNITGSISTIENPPNFVAKELISNFRN